ncbi:glycosyltransferase [Gordonia sp. DT218]|uniref:glycosyltransferase n=1 Tax=Gordonia sp. DT218 TaxID=3416659 RepID=UPI003CF45FCF
MKRVSLNEEHGTDVTGDGSPNVSTTEASDTSIQRDHRRTILHVSEALGGGIHTAIYNYSQAANQANHVIFARIREGQHTQEWPETVSVVEYRGGMLNFYRAASRHIEDIAPDVIHLHSSYAGIMRAWLDERRRIVYSPHCFAMERRGDTRLIRTLYWALEFLLSRKKQVYACVSPREAEIVRFLNTHADAALVPNYNASGATTSVERKNSKAGKEKKIITIGRVSKQKDPIFFANIAKDLGNDYNMIWVGDGDKGYKKILEDSGVLVTGWVTPIEVAQIVESADLYLHTAAWEGAPLSAIEAATMGCPVIARTIPSMASLRYPLGGRDHQQVSCSVKRFFSQDEYRRTVTAQTRAVVEENSPGLARSTLDAIYAVDTKSSG